MWLIAWSVALPVSVGAVLPLSLPAWLRMWAVALVTYAGCKEAMWRTRANRATTWTDRVAWWLGWPGMNVDGFLRPADHGQVAAPSAVEWLFAIGKVVAGLAWLWFITPLAAGLPDYWLGWVGMLGLAFVLHFGLFHVLSCLWRARGIAAPPLMNWPIAAKSVGDYWGNRWNRAFRDLATRNILRPVMKRHGAAWATMAVFLFSGLIHDLVISIPAGGGWGLPTLYFLIQGVAHLAEQSAWGKRIGLGSDWRGRLFAWLVVILPCPLLFHPPFMANVVVPFLKVIHAA